MRLRDCESVRVRGCPGQVPGAPPGRRHGQAPGRPPSPPAGGRLQPAGLGISWRKGSSTETAGCHCSATPQQCRFTVGYKFHCCRKVSSPQPRHVPHCPQLFQSVRRAGPRKQTRRKIKKKIAELNYKYILSLV